MSRADDRALREACLATKACSATDIEQAIATRYQMRQRGEDMDLLDILLVQGALTTISAHSVRVRLGGAEAAAGANRDEGPPGSDSADSTPAQPSASRAAASPRAVVCETVAATMDFSAEDLEQALLDSQGGGWPDHPTQPAVPRPPEVPAFGHDLGGRVLGSCRLDRELGRGAMGVVFEATHLSLQRRVAVKVLQPGAREAEDVAQFLQEARAMARIEHENIVQVHDVGEEAGLHYIVMQFLDGGTVADRLDHERMIPWEDACRLARDAARGLAIAHGKGIVHRDVKPENLMLTSSGQVKIADFGLAAKATGEDDRSEVMGTPAYMAPETIDGRAVDGRSDIYSLGCTLYAMLTGRRPFEGETAIEVLLKQTKDVATPVSTLTPSVPESVSQLVEKCMAKSPAARYQTADELAGDLEKILSGGRPRIVVEIEDVMARMQEVSRAEAALPRGVARRPAFAVTAALVLVTGSAIVSAMALPNVDELAVERFLRFPPTDRATAAAAARAELTQAVQFAVDHRDGIDLVRARFDDLAKRHGDTLGSELTAARQKAEADFDAHCVAEFGKVRSQAEELARGGDAVAATKAVFAFPETLRRGHTAEAWKECASHATDAVRQATRMAYVPAGRAGDTDVPAFLIGLTEVSNAEWAEFVRETGARAPRVWAADVPPAAARELPVVGITPAEAAKYAAWRGLRLPTAAEWERAARGDAAATFPWGEDFDPARCVSRAGPRRELVGVATMPSGRSSFGVFHMAGNAAEWVADSSNDPVRGVGHEVRGGSAKSHPSACATTARYFLPEDTASPDLLVGFRCAKDVK
jgi:eukaryotic-like serine/threonine-protein kinase